MLHPVLQRQLRKLGLGVDTAPEIKSWACFVERVNRYYHDLDQNQYTVERSLEISSEEMRELTSQLQSALEQIRESSLTDELTGLRNRRFLNMSLPDEAALVLREYRKDPDKRRDGTGSSIIFLIVDMDFFKEVNDTYGHVAGDMVLSQMGKLLADCSRETDYVIRLGGDEFLIVGKQARNADLAIFAERIRQAVQEYPFDFGQLEPVHMTCSIGASVFPFLLKWPNLLSWDYVVKVADICLYAAKRSGRNAWVGIPSSKSVSPYELALPLDEHLPKLIQKSRLELVSNLPLKKVLFQ